jgi:hypothetical protein
MRSSDTSQELLAVIAVRWVPFGSHKRLDRCFYLQVVLEKIYNLTRYKRLGGLPSMMAPVLHSVLKKMI